MNWILVSLKIEVVVMSCCLCALLTTVAVFKNRKKCLSCLKPYTLYSSRQKERNFKNRGSVLVQCVQTARARAARPARIFARKSFVYSRRCRINTRVYVSRGQSWNNMAFKDIDLGIRVIVIARINNYCTYQSNY